MGVGSRLSVRRNLSPPPAKGKGRKDSDLDAFVSEDGSEPEPGLPYRGREVKFGGFCRVLFPPSPTGRRVGKSSGGGAERGRSRGRSSHKRVLGSCLLLDVELDASRK